jgi:hypothetical protein
VEIINIKIKWIIKKNCKIIFVNIFMQETFNEDDLTGLQSIDVDYGQIDADED